MKRRKRYFIKTYGCQMNDADSLWLEKIFERCGYSKAVSLEEADVILINSCSVRQAAEDKVYGWARKINELRARSAEEKSPKEEGQALNSPGLGSKISSEPSPKSLALRNSGFEELAKLQVILTGCMVGSATGERRRIKLSDLKKRMPWVDYFIPPGEIFARLPEILSDLGGSTKETRSIASLQKPGAVVLPAAEPKKSARIPQSSALRAKLWEGKELSPGSSEPSSFPSGEEAYVPVMQGCDQFCSYCVVPYGRGPEISRPMTEIVAEVERLVKQGVKKITLLGQNVNSYGKTYTNQREWEANAREYRDRPHPFAQLLRRLHEIEGLEKIWFLTSNPWDFSDDLINALTLPKLEKYLHLPVQSGDDEILKKMNRPYTAQEYKELVRKIKAKVPEIKLGTDIIVGFPGESEEQFQNTVDLVKEIGFEGAFVAMYSPRPGTAAAKLYEDNVSREEKRRRHKIILDLVKKERGRKSGR